MRTYTLPDGSVIDLDTIAAIGPLFVNKNYPEYSCYEVNRTFTSDSISLFEVDLPRATLLALWTGA